MSDREKRRKEANDYLIAGWSKRYGRKVAMGEVEEIKTNLNEFVNVMGRIDQYLKQRDGGKNLSLSENSDL